MHEGSSPIPVEFTKRTPGRKEANVEVRENREAEGETIMQSSVPYVMHAIAGRVRVKVPAVRGSSAMADAVASRVGAIDGVDHVKANPTTGSVVVYYTPGLTSSEAILAALRARMAVRFFPQPESTETARSVASSYEASTRLATRMLHLAMDLAVQRLVMALVP
jgi:hypothetical protein